MATKLNKSGKEVEVTRVEGYYSKVEIALIDKAAKIASEKAGAHVSRKAFTEQATLERAALLIATNNKKKLSKTS